jgi:FixJ family two-component response regulator
MNPYQAITPLLEDERKVADLRTRQESLTARERQVMALLVAGRVNKQIAAEIAISEVTVRLHRGQIMRKMRASSLADLIRIADKIKL